MYRKLTDSMAILGIAAVLALFAACGSSESVGEGSSSTGEGDEGSAVKLDPATPEPAPDIEVQDFEVGNDIGNRIPGFEIKLTDGTPITAAGLLQNGKPAFLFFFSTT